MSFALPTIDMGGRSGAAPGIAAAYYALWVAPTVGLLLRAGAVHAGDIPFAFLMAAYYPTLALANLVVPLSLARRIHLGRSLVAIALLATGVPLTPWPQLWRVLELADGERVRLEIGYVVWLASLWLAALVSARRPRVEVRTLQRPVSSPTIGPRFSTSGPRRQK